MPSVRVSLLRENNRQQNQMSKQTDHGNPQIRIPASLAFAVIGMIFMSNMQKAFSKANKPGSNGLVLRYQRPATVCMNEALPVGNGRLGGMVFGNPATERIVLNED